MTRKLSRVVRGGAVGKGLYGTSLAAYSTSSTVRRGLFGKGAIDYLARQLPYAEIEIGIVERGCLRRRVPSLDALQRRVAALETERNTAHATIDWRLTTGDARVRLARLYPKLDPVGDATISKSKSD